MENRPVRVLLIEDDEDDFVLVRDLLDEISTHSYEISWVADYPTALERMCSHDFDVCLLDYRLGSRDGLELLHAAVATGYRTPTIFLTGLGTYQSDVAGMAAGAVDYLLKKEISAAALERSIRYALQRKRVEDELRRSEEKYRELVENANSAIMRLDPQGRITFFNEFAETFFGYSQAEIEGRSPIGTIIPPTDSVGRDTLSVFQQVLLAPEHYPSLEMEATRRSGERAWVVWSNRAMVNENAESCGILSIGTDVTEKKRTEELLRLDEARSQALVQLGRMTAASVQEIADFALEQAVSLTRSKFGLMAFLNEGHAIGTVTGWPKELLQPSAPGEGNPPLVIQDSGIWDTVTDQRKLTVINDCRGFPHGIVGCHPGLVQLSRLMVAPVPERNRIAALILVGNKDEAYTASDERHVTLLTDSMSKMLQSRRDQDALARSEMELRENNKLLQKIFDGISDPLVMVERDFSVVMMNRGARDYYGLEGYDEVQGQPCYKALAKRSEPCEECGRFMTMLDGPSTIFERKCPKDPSRYEQVAIYAVTGAHGKSDAAIVRISDITTKRMLERQLVQNEKLASLGLLVSSIAHEINNPNTFISFNLPILKQYLEALMPVFDHHAESQPGLELFHMPYAEFRDDLFKLLDNMEHGSSRIGNIVSSLRGFMSKREKSQLQSTDLKSLIDATVAICLPEIRKRVRYFDVIVPPDFPEVSTDPEAIQHILVNLLINAAHACDKQSSRVTLEVRCEDTAHGTVIIEVSDNGIGMDERTKERVFDPFFTTKGPTSGTGLGLYVCYNLINSLGGAIEVDSAPGEGSTFRVILPSSPQLDSSSDPALS